MTADEAKGERLGWVPGAVTVLGDAAPFVDLLPRETRERIVGELDLPKRLGAAPVGEFAERERRAVLAERLAPVVVDGFPSTLLGSLLPGLRTVGERRLSMVRFDGRLRAILRRESHLQAWDVLAERTVTELLEIRNVGPTAARAIVTAAIELAVAASLPAALRPDRTLACVVEELVAMLDDRGWLVLASRQVSLRDRVSAIALARSFGCSRTRVRQLEKQAEQELRDALDDPHFNEVAAAAARFREVLGDGPRPIHAAFDAGDIVAADGADRLGEDAIELLVWCAGPYDLVDDELVLRVPPPRRGDAPPFVRLRDRSQPTLDTSSKVVSGPLGSPPPCTVSVLVEQRHRRLER